MTDIKYISTRGQAPKLSFSDVLLTGLATDGGLYVPERLPKINIEDFRDKTYQETAYTVMSQFVGEAIEPEVLKNIITESYATFDHKDVAPLVELDENLWVLEQFHGPTLAFKDFALQFLGRAFDAVLEKLDRHITIVGATSGDTGSAAIEGCRGRDNMDIFILHPHGRVSDVQRRQMTTITDNNVHNIAIKGSFDDCQDLVKGLFNDPNFRKRIGISAVNSINWARILAQIVYYVYACSRFNSPVSFSVPTGNFGNIYAGYLARQMGAPIEGLIVATNRNDILYRFFENGQMRISGVEPSLSPSMDIQISSNFERFLFDLLDRDADQTRKVMEAFRKNGEYQVSADVLNKLKQTFSAERCDDDATQDTIRREYDRAGYLLDPHSATGVFAARMWQDEKGIGRPVVCMATAHPAKFPDAVKAASGVDPKLPSRLSDLFDREEDFDVLSNDIEALKDYILGRI
tara:strand:- start:1374 stop:2759 length:1386 start_codon:yes stop_codon:yes gene_type:complete